MTANLNRIFRLCPQFSKGHEECLYDDKSLSPSLQHSQMKSKIQNILLSLKNLNNQV